jgi:Co/Zn/Cd efflux system component
LRTANIFNSVGLIVVSGFLLWQAAERLMHPAPVQGMIVIATGLLAAVANKELIWPEKIVCRHSDYD